MPVPRYEYAGPVDRDVITDWFVYRGKSVMFTGGANGKGEECVQQYVTAGAFFIFGDKSERGAQTKAHVRDGPGKTSLLHRRRCHCGRRHQSRSGNSLWNLDDV